MEEIVIRPATMADKKAVYHVCLKTGNAGSDAEQLYPNDPDALGRIFVGPYIALEPDYAFVAEDADGVCGYVLAAPNSKRFYARYENEWRPQLYRRFPEPQGNPDQWTPTQKTYYLYHHPNYVLPEPYEQYPSHMHIDLLPRARGRGLGRKMMEQLMNQLKRNGSPGVHVDVRIENRRGRHFYKKLGFHELLHTGDAPDASPYMGKIFVILSNDLPGKLYFP